MVSLHDAVGGIGWVLKDLAGHIVATGTLKHGEPQGLFIACLLEYINVRASAAPVEAASGDDASVLPLRRRQLPLRATRR